MNLKKRLGFKADAFSIVPIYKGSIICTVVYKKKKSKSMFSHVETKDGVINERPIDVPEFLLDDNLPKLFKVYGQLVIFKTLQKRFKIDSAEKAMKSNFKLLNFIAHNSNFNRYTITEQQKYLYQVGFTPAFKPQRKMPTSLVLKINQAHQRLNDLKYKCKYNNKYIPKNERYQKLIKILAKKLVSVSNTKKNKCYNCPKLLLDNDKWSDRGITSEYLNFFDDLRVGVFFALVRKYADLDLRKIKVIFSGDGKTKTLFFK
jgi:hypothetical protein